MLVCKYNTFTLTDFSSVLEVRLQTIASKVNGTYDIISCENLAT